VRISVSLAWWRAESIAGTLLFYQSGDFSAKPFFPQSEGFVGTIGAGIIAIGAVGGIVLLAGAVLAVVYLRKGFTHSDHEPDHKSDTGSPPDTLHTTILDWDELGANPSSSESSYATTWKQWSKVVDD
jgi:hypothetical protein